MKKILITLSLILFSTVIVLAQVKEIKHTVYFDKDKHLLKEEQRTLLDAFLRSLEGREVSKITLAGHTDSDASDEYNIELSKNRLGRVQKYLESKGKSATIIQGSFLGESQPAVPNLDENGMKKNRRVDIVVSYKDTAQLVREVEEKKPGCIDGDTTFYLPEGTRYTLSRCDVLKNPGGFRVREFVKPESIIQSGFTTRTTRGEQLVSGGMFTFDICEGCLSRPMTVRLPLPQDGIQTSGCMADTSKRPMALWTGDNHAGWENDTAVKIVKVNDTLVYEFQVDRTTKKNLDYKLPKDPDPRYVRIKFKAKKGIALKTVRLLFQVPLTQYESVPHKRRKNIVYITIHRCPQPDCNQNILVYSEGKNANGDSIVMPPRNISTVKYRKAGGKCKNRVDMQIFGIVLRWSKTIYRKYILYPDYYTTRNRISTVMVEYRLGPPAFLQGK
jgi:hypothetical protein